MPVPRQSPGPGQESVWDYSRPPRVEPFPGHIQVKFAGQLIADTRGAFRLLETSHPPTYYLPQEAFRAGVLVPSQRRTVCEWKGVARYFSIVQGDKEARDVAWSYPEPLPGFEALAGCVALYAGPMDKCLVDGERVEPQPGGFYGGWITSRVVGPFKGGPGSHFW